MSTEYVILKKDSVGVDAHRNGRLRTPREAPFASASRDRSSRPSTRATERTWRSRRARGRSKS